MNVKCDYLDKCIKSQTDYCSKCKKNKSEDFFEEIDDYEDYDEDYDEDEEEEEEKDEWSKKIAKDEKFKDCPKDNKLILKFIQNHYPKIIEEWEDFSIEEIIKKAKIYHKYPEEMDKIDSDFFNISEEEQEACARKMAEHPDFSRCSINHISRMYFMKKHFTDFYDKISGNSGIAYKVSNLSRAIYDLEIKKRRN